MLIAIRADASLEIGTGHVMRCKTLADALRPRRAEVRFVCRQQPGHLIRWLRDAGYPTIELPAPASAGTARAADRNDYAAWLGVEQSEDARQTIAALGDFRPDWLVVDHYGLDADWERLLRPCAGKILALDDLANRVHDCDVLVDQNFAADMESRYRGLAPARARRLLGPRYALLRPEFRKARESLRERDGAVRRILVFFGGADPTAETGKALDALASIDLADIEIDVVVGDTNLRADDIRARCTGMPNVRFHRQVSNMAALMAAADFSLAAGGTSNWERCCVGLPSAVTIVAENQSQIACDLAVRGALLALGDARQDGAARYTRALETVTGSQGREKLLAMQSAAFALVDGRGTDRVILSISDEPVRLRHAGAEDAAAAWAWRNHGRTRQYSLNSSTIPLAEHLSWWNQSLAEPNRILLIGARCGLDVGVLRYDLGSEGVAVVSVYLDPDLSGLGLGVSLLQAGNRWMLLHHPGVCELHAQIAPDNETSIRAFEAAGFSPGRGIWILSMNKTKIEK